MSSSGERFSEFDAHWSLLPTDGQASSTLQAQAPQPMLNWTMTTHTATDRDTAIREAETIDFMLKGLLEIKKQLPHIEPTVTVKRKYDAHKERARLALAIANNDREAVARIVEKHPTLLRMRDDDGHVPLTHAANNGALMMVSCLILLEAERAGSGTGKEPYITCRDSRGRAPIHQAIVAGHLNVIDLLIEAGTPFDIRTGGNRLPLLAHACRHSEAVAAHLLACLPAALWELADDKGKSAVHHAITANAPATLKLLLQAGCKAHVPDRFGNTPLNLAARLDTVACMELLLASASPGDINAANRKGNTPLHEAASTGNLDAVRLLVKNKAQIDLPNRDGWTALAVAVDKGHLEIIKYLIKRRAQPLFGNTFRAWPVTLALKSGDEQRIKIFGSAGYLDPILGVRITRHAALEGDSVVVEACLNSVSLHPYHVNKDTMAWLVECGIKGGDPKVVGLLCDKLKQSYHHTKVDSRLERLLLLAQEQGKVELLLPLVRSIERLRLDSDTLDKLLSNAQERKDYALVEALSKTKLVVDGGKLAELPENLLPDPLAREIMNQPKLPKRSLASVFRKPRLPADPSIDATNTASQLALDVTSIDPSTAMTTTLAEQKISALLHQPMTNSLIPLCTAFASAGNLKLSQAQYIIGYGLAKYADADNLPLPGLEKLIGAQAMLEKCHAHRQALAGAGMAMLRMADGRINGEFLHALALVTIATPGTASSGYAAAIADKLATDFGLLPLWAKRLAKVCTQASAPVMTAYSGSFNTDQPPANLLAMLEASILEKFAEEIKVESAPEGFREASFAADQGVLTDFNDLLWRQWDNICEAMAGSADGANGTDASASEVVKADDLSDTDSDVWVSSASEKDHLDS